ncbi:hypothetical protein RFI_20592 [Reticulomyxa filosa]|uniref:Uncharacterized protein n=1 Tax=Reticulomyxa filosa TaxID=46433 RepID=X6MTF6_RETFI|nr:hypothetical protein RFI_20592 [Reticulomyxa filosa]|eukprot:ETO16747.1 hypothetical protein RFI_20592 [Reticulomyxa filosa]
MQESRFDHSSIHPKATSIHLHSPKTKKELLKNTHNKQNRKNEINNNSFAYWFQKMPPSTKRKRAKKTINEDSKKGEEKKNPLYTQQINGIPPEVYNQKKKKTKDKTNKKKQKNQNKQNKKIKDICHHIIRKFVSIE